MGQNLIINQVKSLYQCSLWINKDKKNKKDVCITNAKCDWAGAVEVNVRMQGVKTVVANRCKQSADIWKDGPQQQTAK